MHVIRTRNVHQALPKGVALLKKDGYRMSSRNGEVIVCSEPVTTRYERPNERVIFWPERDANPFFHLMEALWMLAGRNDVQFVANYAKNMMNYSDDGVSLHAAYGYRWRRYYTHDQLDILVRLLTTCPNTRRAVLQMWDPDIDLFGREKNTHKDLPCNTTAYFNIDMNDPANPLNMTVCCRSNDMIWGAYGANAVHFSILLEYMAARLNVPVGTMYQVSNNFHVYLDAFMPIQELPLMFSCPYTTGNVRPYPMIQHSANWEHDLLHMFNDIGNFKINFKEPFFNEVVMPIRWAHVHYKEKNYEKSTQSLGLCQASDWRKACQEWLIRRREKVND